MFSLHRQIVLIAGLFILLAGGALLSAKFTIDHLLHRDAIATGERWARYLALRIDDLEQIAAGEAPSARSLLLLEQLRDLELVYRYKIFAPDGRLVLASDSLRADTEPAFSLEAHNPEAARVVARGEPMAMAKEGQLPHPPFYAEAYVPVEIDGRTVAVVETYVNQTNRRSEYRALFFYAALSIGIFTALAFSLATWTWHRRMQEKRRAEEQIRFLGRHDLMTQLPNWKYFLETLQLELAALPAKGSSLAVHLLDLDRFKDLNNSLGREASDKVMRIVAERLRTLARPAYMAASLGSDSFAILQTNVSGVGAALAFAEHIRSEIEQSIHTDGKTVTVTVSIGVALAPTHANDVRRLMNCADLARERAKAEGRNRVRLFMQDMAIRLNERVEIEDEIRDAIVRERFEIHYQPIFHLRSGRLAGFEALLRLPHKNGGFVQPSVFIPIAEQMGLIHAIGRWTMRNACLTATLWPEHLKLSVNLSPAQFTEGDVVSTIQDALDESGLDPRRLELEVTENLLLSDAEPVLTALRRLKKIGTDIVMDDFGTGYSSLRYLWRFPFNAIKIDASFVQGLENDGGNVEKIITTIVALGRSLNLTVTAEGVETEVQAEFLRMIGCDQVQGFLFGWPVAQQEVAAAILNDYWRGLPVELVRPAASGSGTNEAARAV